jgi:hypothetical protein
VAHVALLGQEDGLAIELGLSGCGAGVEGGEQDDDEEDGNGETKGFHVRLLRETALPDREA